MATPTRLFGTLEYNADFGGYSDHHTEDHVENLAPVAYNWGPDAATTEPIS